MCEMEEGKSNYGGGAGGCQLVGGRYTFHYMYMKIIQDRSLCLKLWGEGNGGEEKCNI